MFDHLKGYQKILVTGPQRSGTRIAAKMIASDTGHRYIDEVEFITHSISTFDSIMSHEIDIVVQCPGMCHVIHKYSTNDTLIVLMRREVVDIIASQERVDWTNGALDEMRKYGIPYNQLRAAIKKGVIVSQMKYDFWEKEQRDVIENFLELKYLSLSSHKLWVPKEERVRFTEMQTA